MGFLNRLGEGTRQATKKFRYALLKAFFNFLRNTIDENIPNPCDTLIMRKIFREPKISRWDILEKDLVDEMIFRTRNRRNRLMLELMARSGMRVGEVLKIRAGDVVDQKIILQDPKSGKESEAVYIPKKVAERLKDYLRTSNLSPAQRIFPFGYSRARDIVMTAGRLVNIRLRSHDLRRHAATYASRSGTPIEIVSKVILRHANLATTQRYLGKITDVEAVRWIENLYIAEDYTFLSLRV
jgi:integrase